MTAPANLQDAALHAITAAAKCLADAQRGIPRAVALAKRHGLDGDQIRMAFEVEGVDFGDLLGLLEGGEG